VTTDPPPRRLERRNILVVEDDADLRDEMAELFLRLGATVERAGTVAAAEAAIATARFDVLVSDLSLPDGTGYEVARMARSAGIEAAVAVTGDRDAAVPELSRAAGFHRYLSKPCNPDALVRAVESLTRAAD